MVSCTVTRTTRRRQMIKMQTIVTIDKSFRSLIQSQNYEKYVFAIITQSNTFFHNLQFSCIDDQSHGESDYMDNHGQLYDAKLLFDQKQGALIGDPKNRFDDWLQAMLDEKTEFGRCIKKRDLSILPDTRLYQVMKDRLASVKPEEHAIFFIPFPIVDENKWSSILQSTTDFLQAVYQRLVDDGLVGNRKVYFIYPSGDPHEYVLRDDNSMQEYIKCEDLEDFISFETRIVME